MGASESKKGKAVVNSFEKIFKTRFRRSGSITSITEVSTVIPSVTSQSQSKSEPTSSEMESLRQTDSKFSVPSSSQSDSVPNFKWLEDRLFMDTSYLLPSDDREKDRNVLQHFMLKNAFGGCVYPPITDTLKVGGHVLDVGCGSGSWCMDVAHEFPNANFLGIDIIPSFPESIYPSNCKFMIMDILKQPMPLEDDSFDLITMELMGMAIITSQWPGILADLRRILKPGGWIQWIEPDTQAWNSGPACSENIEKFRQVMNLRDLDPYLPRKCESFLQRAEYDNVKRQFISLPLGDWGGPLGKVMATNCVEIMASMGPLFRASFGWTSEYLERRVELMLLDMKENKGYVNYHLVIGQKPCGSSSR